MTQTRSVPMPKCRCGGYAIPRVSGDRQVWKCRGCNAEVAGPPLPPPPGAKPPPKPAPPPGGVKHQPGAAGGKPKKKKGKPPRRSAGARDERAAKRGRLPDGSSFGVMWDAESGRWKGHLGIGRHAAPIDGPGKWFEGEADGVFRLLEELDDQYRSWLKEQGGQAAEPVKEGA